MGLYAEHINVSFPGVKALDDAYLKLEPNRVHALLGANGSGKSTMVKVLTGLYHPDKGTGAVIRINDHETNDIINPTQAHDFGIRVVHQETPMIGSFTVAESVGLFKGYTKNKIHGIDWKSINRYTEELLDTFDLKIDPKMQTKDLTAAERNMLAMAIAIGKEEEIKEVTALILDEADASVPEAEAEVFLQHVRRIAEMNIPVVMVTHRLKAVRQYCDDVTILNGGKVVYSGLMNDMEDDDIIAMMSPKVSEDTGVEESDDTEGIRRIWSILKKNPPVPTDKPVLTFRDVEGYNIHKLSFELHAGEILGFVGVSDSGVTQLPLILGCDLRRTGGEYTLKGSVIPLRTSPRTVFKKGLCLLPADRNKRGGIMPLNLQDNMLLPCEESFWHKRKLADSVVKEMGDLMDVNPRGAIAMEFGKFSGGNQQKAIMGKWLMQCPSVFVLDDMTYGVDPSSRIKLFNMVRTAAEQNMGIILFSTEPEQLAGICTRVLVMSQGRIVNEMKADDGTLTREAVARWCYA